MSVNIKDLDILPKDDPALLTLLQENWKERQKQAALPTNQTSMRSLPQVIKNLQSFILTEVPYGLSVIDDVQNMIIYDGPNLPAELNLPDSANRPPLYWYFNGDVYKIMRAVTFIYTYRNISASGIYVSQPDAIYVGFEAPYDDNGYTDPKGLQCSPALRDPKAALATSVPVSFRTDPEKLNLALNIELDALSLDFRYHQVGWVDYAGPARAANSAAPFKMTVADLVNAPDEFSKLLFWQFDGRQQRIAKGMRLQCLDNDSRIRTILIGYQGYGGTVPG